MVAGVPAGAMVYDSDAFNLVPHASPTPEPALRAYTSSAPSPRLRPPPPLPLKDSIMPKGAASALDTTPSGRFLGDSAVGASAQLNNHGLGITGKALPGRDARCYIRSAWYRAFTA